MELVPGKKRRVIVIGAGGLAHPATYELVMNWPRAVGLDLIIYDGDRIERSNLPRQFLFSTQHLGHNKAQTIGSCLEHLTPRDDINISSFPVAITNENLPLAFSGASLVLDCCDHVPTKFLAHDHCVREQIPFCYAGAIELRGLVLGVMPQGIQPGCLRCLFGADADQGSDYGSCQSAGILGPVVGLIGSVQARMALTMLFPALHGSSFPRTAEPVKRTSGMSQRSMLLRFSADSMEWTEHEVIPRPSCPLQCGQSRTAFQTNPKSAPALIEELT